MPAATAHACMTDFTAALIARDMPAALSHLADDAVLFYSNGSTINGKDAFSAVMTASWKVVENYAYETRDYTWVVESDDIAAVIYSFAWSGTARGEKVQGSGRATRVFRNTPAGWRVAHEHLSNGQGPA